MIKDFIKSKDRVKELPEFSLLDMRKKIISDTIIFGVFIASLIAGILSITNQVGV